MEERSNFNLSGPKGFSERPIDWSNDEHRRIISACLVNGAYVRRQDLKQKNAPSRDPLAEPWWESLRFKEYKTLGGGSKVHALIYRLDNEKTIAMADASVNMAPNLVVAIRGTQSLTDVSLDLLLSTERLQHTNRVQSIFNEVVRIILHELVHSKSHNIWLTGHSLGASVATLVGLTIAEEHDVLLETFLFNPPFVRLDPVIMTDSRGKYVVEKTQKLLGKLLKPIMDRVEDESIHYKNIHNWVPMLFVNPDDKICKGFIKYFEHQHKFRGMRPGHIMRVEEGSDRYCMSRIQYKNDKYSIYLLYSGRLITNMARPVEETHPWRIKDFNKYKKAHELSQWWKENSHFDVKGYIFEVDE